MLSTAEALMAVPEPEGVTLWRMPVPFAEPGGLRVDVGFACGTAGPRGTGKGRCGLIAVPLDLAHDLSWRGPDVFVWPVSGSSRGVEYWEVTAFGFIEEEARGAFEAVCDAIGGTAWWAT
jgi:hypothetical protein